MMTLMSTTSVEHDSEHGRYLFRLDDQVVGGTYYRDTEEGRIFMHTEVDPAFQHHGYATQLIRGALDDTRAAGRKPIAQCPTVRNFLSEHPDYATVPRR
jgi:uncharacterized protein